MAGWGVDRTDAAGGTGTGIVIDHGSLGGLSDDDHSQYLLASAATSRAAFAANWTDLTDGGATTLHSHSMAHSALTGLTSGDDHTQYVLLAGRSGGQIIRGGTAASETLALRGTSHATVGIVSLNDLGGHVTIGGGTSASELRFLEPSGSGTNYTAIKAQAQSGNVTYTLPAADATVDGYALKSNAAGTLSWGPAGGVELKQSVAQSSHGFSVGNVLYHNGTIFALADADAAATAEVVGIVQAVTDSNNFVLLYGGYIDTLSGLTAGTVYFLSGTAGALTATEPSTVGQISKPLLVATSTTAGYFVNMRGAVVGTAASSFAVSQASGNGSTTAFSLPATPSHENNVFVTISGVAQHKDTFSVSGSTLTFSEAPPTGTSNIEFCVVGALAIGTPSDGTVTNAKLAAGALFTAATEQVTTSGTAVDFTGIPSGTQQIIVQLEGISINGTSVLLIQLGDSGGVETSGYSGIYGVITTGGAANAVTATNGAAVYNGADATGLASGQVVFTLKDAANNTWTWEGVNYWSASGGASMLAGVKSLSAVLDRIRFTSGNPDTLDAGSINILYR